MVEDLDGESQGYTHPVSHPTPTSTPSPSPSPNSSQVSVKDGRTGYVKRLDRKGRKGQQLFQLEDQAGSLGADKYSVHQVRNPKPKPDPDPDPKPKPNPDPHPSLTYPDPDPKPNQVDELRKEPLDVTREQKVAAPLLPLEGSSAHVVSSAEEGRDGAGDWWSGVLGRAASPRAKRAPSRCTTQDLQVDELAVFVQPDGRCAVRRVEPAFTRTLPTPTHTLTLTRTCPKPALSRYVVHRVEDGKPILREEVMLDEVAVAAAAALACHALLVPLALRPRPRLHRSPAARPRRARPRCPRQARGAATGGAGEHARAAPRSRR